MSSTLAYLVPLFPRSYSSKPPLRWYPDSSPPMWYLYLTWLTLVVQPDLVPPEPLNPWTPETLVLISFHLSWAMCPHITESQRCRLIYLAVISGPDSILDQSKAGVCHRASIGVGSGIFHPHPSLQYWIGIVILILCLESEAVLLIRRCIVVSWEYDLSSVAKGR